MLNFSYTISPFLKKELETLVNIRDGMLLQLVNPQDEIQLSWDALIERIHYSLILDGIQTSKKNIVSTLSRTPTLKNAHPEIIGYRNSLSYIKQDWFYRPNLNITIYDLLSLYKSVYPKFEIHNTEYSRMLSFLQVNPEPPIIQAAIAFIMMYHILGKNNFAIRMSTLLSYVFMYKYGYSFRNMIVLEEHFAIHKTALEGALMATVKAKNLSPFLDVFIFAVEDQAKKALYKLRSKTINNDYPKGFFELTERQKHILAELDRPGARITNKIVQKLFKISQITASRELSNLTNLGLLKTSGKGRSIYYTKG